MKFRFQAEVVPASWKWQKYWWNGVQWDYFAWHPWGGADPYTELEPMDLLRRLVL